MREREMQRRIGSHRSSAQTAAPLDTPISITGVRRVINSRGGGGDGGDGGVAMPVAARGLRHQECRWMRVLQMHHGEFMVGVRSRVPRFILGEISGCLRWHAHTLRNDGD